MDVSVIILTVYTPGIGILLVGQELGASCYFKDIVFRDRTEKRRALQNCYYCNLIVYYSMATITLTFTTTTISAPATTTSITTIFEIDVTQTPSL